MRIEKPDDVRHENAAGKAAAIYGVDAHPTQQLFATAGGDGSVKIWSLASPGGDGEVEFELVATLAFHEGAVNCVRWAAHGRYLASGSRDQLVLLYELQPGAPPPVPFGSTALPNKQNWVRCSTLKRHTMDVQDLAWSPDDRLLATCSIDNTICIWDVDSAGLSPTMSEPLHVLSGHNGWVKGVAWDPVGKYLTSAGEDKTLRVWRVDTWQEAHVVSEPFESCSSTSHFRRLSWAPDGSVVCGTHGFKSQNNVAALVNRTSWSNDVDFVGHRSVVTCTRFNPKLFVKDAASDKEYACCAVGGDDASVSVWLAQMARPLTVLKDCFSACVTDLSWAIHDDIPVLLTVSLDGTLCYFQFEQGEIGIPISDVRQSKLLQTKYGSRAGIILASTFVENPVQLQLEEKSSKTGNALAANTLVLKKKSSSGGQPVAAKTGAVNILQAVSKSGKKRITPVALNDNGRGPNAPLPTPTPNAASVANEIRNILGPPEPSPLTDTSLLEERMTAKPASKATPADSKRQQQQSLKRKRDGDRNGQGGPATAAGAAVMAKAKDVAVRPPRVLMQSSDPTGAGEPVLPALPVRLSFAVTIDTGGSSIPAPTSSELQAANQLTVEVTVHNLKAGEAGDFIELGPVYSTVRCLEGTSVKWVDRMPGRVVAVVGNAAIAAIGTSTGDLFILSASGRRLFPCIALGATIAVIECSPHQSSFVMVILSSGAVKIWDMETRKLRLNDSIEPLVSAAYAMSQKVTLLRSNVTATGKAMMTMAITNTESKGSANLHSYTFDEDMESWMRVADDSFIYSDFHSSLPTDAVVARDIPVGPLRRLQNASGFSRTQRGVASAIFKDIPDAIMQRNVTRAHLEHQVATAVALESTPEYQYWLKAYVRFLASDEDVARLEELCAEMLGPFKYPAAAAQADAHWNPTVLGLAKRKLLQTQILPTIATNRTLQRVVAKYQLMLSDIEARTASKANGERAQAD